ncbi:uncharacterized protein LOC111358127 isoform X1 [Spodoptera litura]|uniref:Uncharacterized protein LOC111358127 isoform X1 n=1 Tax=Spodoptera litura TaxID=69820 RepID=A0A9J7EIU0_SPOLT|nr:uncharacterized protein LOC111358127 isoform X1 [Spodoptera litura]
MRAPVLRKVIDKILFICQNTGVYNTHYCSQVKLSEPRWKVEKQKTLNLSPEEKKNKYDKMSVVTVDMVDPWNNYVIRNSTVEKRKHTLDDVTEFNKFKIDNHQNKSLAEKVSLYKGDITRLEVLNNILIVSHLKSLFVCWDALISGSAIVNAANSMLKAGGGVDGAIHRAAGPHLQEECDTLGGCPTGEAKITGGYNLPSQYVIHTVGPQDASPAMLKKCYENSLAFHKSHKITTIAFPCISTGIYGFPNRLAAHIALRTTRQFLEQNDRMERVIFCTFMPVDVEIYETLMQMYFPVHDWNYADDARTET